MFTSSTIHNVEIQINPLKYTATVYRPGSQRYLYQTAMATKWIFLEINQKLNNVLPIAIYIYKQDIKNYHYKIITFDKLMILYLSNNNIYIKCTVSTIFFKYPNSKLCLSSYPWRLQRDLPPMCTGQSPPRWTWQSLPEPDALTTHWTHAVTGET